jgi:acetate kinase
MNSTKGAMRNILVINAGSSSMKYQLIDASSETRRASGLIERIGSGTGRVKHRTDDTAIGWETPIADHSEAFTQLTQAFADSGLPLDELGIVAVGHRVVQGGSEFVQPTVIDDRVSERILALAELAPLHNPGHHRAIEAARRTFPDVPHVAVFDTAFHQTMPEVAYTYAIDPKVAAEHGVRRYGFHGISHEVVSRRAADLLGRPVTELNQIVLHLGNGASMCAVRGGVSVDTSMGLTPLEGLVMGSRSGDIDAGALLHLLRRGLSVAELDSELNTRSGLVGMFGSNDMRDVRDAMARGDKAAQLAFDVYVHRLRHYLGAYLVELCGADTIVFTAGVGENHAPLREAVCAGLDWFGIEIDRARDSARVISSDASRVAILVVPTDEETEIARQTAALAFSRN